MTPPPPPAPQELRALTGLRGIAALLVAAYHYTGFGVMAPPLLAPLFGRGYLGVDLFFVLSGFVMALRYGGMFAPGRARFGEFLRRRFWRIYPAYAVTILTAFVLVRTGMLTAQKGAGSWSTLLIDLLLLQCFGAAPGIVAVSWSLSTEWAAYLAFPALCRLALFRGWRTAAVLTALALLTILFLCLLPAAWLPGVHTRTILHHPMDHSDTRTIYPLLRCFADFVLGLVAWRLSRLPAAAAVARTEAANGVALAVTFAVLWTPAADWIIAPLSAMLLICLADSDARPALAARTLGAPPVRWLGLVSYSLYLTHLLLWQCAHGLTDRAGLPSWVLLAPALLLAWLLYTAVEQPARRLGQGNYRRT